MCDKELHVIGLVGARAKIFKGFIHYKVIIILTGKIFVFAIIIT